MTSSNFLNIGRANMGQIYLEIAFSEALSQPQLENLWNEAKDPERLHYLP